MEVLCDTTWEPTCSGNGETTKRGAEISIRKAFSASQGFRFFLIGGRFMGSRVAMSCLQGLHVRIYLGLQTWMTDSNFARVERDIAMTKVSEWQWCLLVRIVTSV
ncbi:hypothetical protein TWF217_002464 [Orbilia oligospora]|nr:hypothetical protein TWF217_002464 [Orbilia oligospora]